MSYNILHGRGMDNVLDLNRAADVINKIKPDLCALQEVDHFCQRTDSIDQTKFLVSKTNMAGTFGKFMEYQGGEYGMAILTNKEVVSTEVLPLPNGQYEPRSSILQEIKLANGCHVLFANVHLDWVNSEEGIRNRLNQAKTLLNHLNKSNKATIIIGDFNCKPDSPTMIYFIENGFEFIDKGEDKLSYQGKEPAEIDHIIFRNNKEVKILPKKIRLLYEPIISDHRPLVAEIEVIML